MIVKTYAVGITVAYTGKSRMNKGWRSPLTGYAGSRAHVTRKKDHSICACVFFAHDAYPPYSPLRRIGEGFSVDKSRTCNKTVSLTVSRAPLTPTAIHQGDQP